MDLTNHLTNMQTKTQQKRLAKYETEEKDKCPFCSAPLIEELGVKRCQNSSCTYKVKRKLEQSKLIK